ncbi:HAD family hydrolase [Bernardetia sp.]|uniref:HAD family hydrolase n=1 Tax=Bernardetia sp. TaxID=1937974 RepID=UPI0025BDAFA1|nr:HAD family phosphatase [Bernardetia sp.]
MSESTPKLYDYEAIIFDLGGVIINLSYKKTEQAFKKIFGTDFSEAYSKQSQTEIFNQLETGQISEKEFVEAMQKSSSKEVKYQEIIDAWNAMLLDIPKERIELLKEIGQKKRIFLLSNTNEIHKKAFDNIIFQSHNMDGLEPLFEKSYFSHLVGMRKPNKEIFDFVIKENNLNPQKTLFIDDSPQHIEGARKANLKAYHLEISTHSVLDLI